MWWIAGASAATLTVGQGQAYSTIRSAVAAAADGDTIEVYAGVYRERLTIDKELSLVGIGDPVIRPSNPGPFSHVLIFTVSGSLTGFTIRGDGVTPCVSVSPGLFGSAVFSVDTTTFSSCDTGLAVDDFVDVTLTDDRFLDNVVGFDGSTGQVALTRSLFARNVVGAQFDTGTVRGSGFVYNEVALTLGAVRSGVVEQSVFCGQTSSALRMWVDTNDPAAGPTAVRFNRFAENTGAEGGGLRVQRAAYVPSAELELVGNSFVGNQGSLASQLYGSGVDVSLVDNLFAHGAAGAPAVKVVAIGGSGGDVTGDYGLFWSNAGGDTAAPQVPADFGPHTLFGVDPRFASWTADGVCDDDLRLLPGSPAIDAGDPTLTDHRDGSRADIGWVPWR